MKKLQWMAACSAIALISSGCASGVKQAKAPKPQGFENPTVQASAPPVLPAVKLQQMLPPVSVPTVPTVPVVDGRDPFAGVVSANGLKFDVEPPQAGAAQQGSTTTAIIGPFLPKPKAAAPVKPSVAVAPVKPTVSKPTAQPKALAKASASKLPVLPAPAALTPLPPLATPSLPIQIPVVPSAADAIAITGVVQVAGKWTAIVQEPNSTPRYVQVGDAIANGRIVLKRITMSAGGNPTIILMENGKEVIKSLGSTVAQG